MFTLAMIIMPLNATKPVYQDNSQPIEKRVEDALQRMTLEEKVKLCTAQSKFSSHGVPRLGIPEIWMSDGPHGVRAEIEWNSWSHARWTNDSSTAFPALTCLAATFNPSLAHDYGVAVGEELTGRMHADLRRAGLCEEVAYHAGYDQYWKMPTQESILRTPSLFEIQTPPLNRVKLETRLVKQGEPRGFWMHVRIRSADELQAAPEEAL